MAASATSLEFVQKMFLAYFGRPVIPTGQEYYGQLVDAGKVAALKDDFWKSAESQALFGNLSTEASVNAIFNQLFGRDAAVSGLTYWSTEIKAGRVSLPDAALTILNSAAGADLAVFNAKLSAASAFTAALDSTAEILGYQSNIAGGRALLAGVKTQAQADTVIAAIDAEVAQIVSGTAPDQTFTLTSGTDNFVGTVGPDFFNAPIMQNAWAGGVSNSLSSADKLDGGAGTDTLRAELVPEFFGVTGDHQIDVQPRTRSIEIVEFEARDTGGNNTADRVVTVDAKNMTGITKIGSHFSDGDLVIENLTTLTDNGAKRNTEAITVVMDHTDNMNSDGDASDLTVLFDEDYLLSGQETQHTLELRLVNAYELAKNTKPLTGFLKAVFNVGSTTVTVDLSAADTYDKVVAAVNAQLAAQGITTVTASKLADRTAVFTDDVGGYTQGTVAGTYTPVLLTSTSDALTSGPIELDSNVKDFNGLNTWTNPTSQTSNNPVTVNIELEKVGRDGDGGDLKIGGKDTTGPNTDKDKVDGIAVFNIAVRGDDNQPSNLGTISSTNNALNTVNVSNHASWSGADLTVRNQLGEGTELTLINATGFAGDFSLGMSGAGQQALTSNFGSGNDSYNWQSVQADGVSSNKAYSISMGAGNDTVRVNLDGDSVDARGESFTLNTGEGNDTATITMQAGVSQETMKILNNLSVDAGAGNDTVTLNSYGNFRIDTGAGDDFVHINSLGSSSNNGDANSGTWTFGQTTGLQTWGTTFGGANADATVDARVLYKATLTLSFAGFEKTVEVVTTAANNFVATQATINTAIKAAIDGDASLKKLLTYTEGTGTQQLTVRSTIGGENTLAIAVYQPELVTGVAATAGQIALAAADESALRQGLINTTTGDSTTFANAATIVAWATAQGFNGSVNSTGTGNGTTYTYINNDTNLSRGDVGVAPTTQDIFDLAGGALYQNYANGGSSDSTWGINVSTINVGTGSDLVVFHSNDSASNVLKITGAFDTTKVVNFHNVPTNLVDDATGGANEMGKHAIDFTSLLNNEVDPSLPAGNDQSKVPVAVSLNVVAGAESLTGLSAAAGNTNAAAANGVNTIRFVESGVQTFANLNAATLVAALNDAAGTGATNYGNLTGALLDPAVFGVTLVGNTQKHIVMVENGLNQGEYKVFYLTSTLNAGKTATATLGGAGGAANQFDTATVQELGTLDFGASINFQLVGSTAYTSYINALVDAYDNNLATFDYDANGNGTVAGGEGTTTVPGKAGTPAADNATTVSATQAATTGGQVLNKAGNMVDVSTIKTIEAPGVLTATSTQALTMSGVTGAITISDPVNALFANAIDAKFSGVITATISDGTMALLAGLNAGPNAYAITLSEATVSAAALTALDAKTTVVIDSGNAAGAGAVTGLTGTIAEAGAAFAAAATNGLDGDETVVVSDTSADIANLVALNSATTGTIDASTVVTVTAAAAGTIDLSAAGITWASSINVTGSSGADTITAVAGGGIISGKGGDDGITGGAGNDTFKFEATAAANGADTITAFLGAGTDKLDFTAFLGGAASVANAGTGADFVAAGLDLSGAQNVGVVFNTAGGAIATGDIQTGTATSKIAVEDNGKAVVLVNADTDGTGIDTSGAADWNVYYIEDTDAGAGQTWVVTLVGTLVTNSNIDTAAEMAAAAAYV